MSVSDIQKKRDQKTEIRNKSREAILAYSFDGVYNVVRLRTARRRRLISKHQDALLSCIKDVCFVCLFYTLKKCNVCIIVLKKPFNLLTDGSISTCKDSRGEF